MTSPLRAQLEGAEDVRPTHVALRFAHEYLRMPRGAFEKHVLPRLRLVEIGGISCVTFKDFDRCLDRFKINPELSTSGSVYLVHAKKAEAVKIGFSESPRARISDIQTACPEILDVLAVIPGGALAERKLHVRYDYLRLHGEWFRAAPELLKCAARLKANPQGRLY